MKKVLSLALLLSVTAPAYSTTLLETLTSTAADVFDALYLKTYAQACKKAGANPTHATVNVPERKTTFKTEVHGKDLFSRLSNIARRLTGYEEAPKTVTLTGTTEFSGGETDAQAKFKEALVSYTSNPDAQTAIKCAKQDHEKGSTITCNGTFNLEEFKTTIDELSK